MTSVPAANSTTTVPLNMTDTTVVPAASIEWFQTPFNNVGAELYIHKFLLGEGNTAVWLGSIECTTGKKIPCAVKKVSQEELQDRCIKLQQCLSEQNVQLCNSVQQYGHAKHEFSSFIIMEKVDLTISDLLYCTKPKHIMMRINLSISKRVHLMKQLVIAVQELHKLNIAHRDLKAANVGLDDTLNQVKLLDFESIRVSSGQNTALNAYGGSILYMSAKRIEALVTNEQLPTSQLLVEDVYALCVLLGEVFWNVRPSYGIPHASKLTNEDLRYQRRSTPMNFPFQEDCCNTTFVALKRIIWQCFQGKTPTLGAILSELNKIVTINEKDELKCRGNSTEVTFQFHTAFWMFKYSHNWSLLSPMLQMMPQFIIEAAIHNNKFDSALWNCFATMFPHNNSLVWYLAILPYVTGTYPSTSENNSLQLFVAHRGILFRDEATQIEQKFNMPTLTTVMPLISVEESLIQSKIKHKKIDEIMQYVRDGNVPTMHALGLYFLTQNEFHAAYVTFSVAARFGFAKAMYDLGDCYFNGTGVKMCVKTALKYYQESYSHGFASAKTMIKIARTTPAK